MILFHGKQKQTGSIFKVLNTDLLEDLLFLQKPSPLSLHFPLAVFYTWCWHIILPLIKLVVLVVQTDVYQVVGRVHYLVVFVTAS